MDVKEKSTLYFSLSQLLVSCKFTQDQYFLRNLQVLVSSFFIE